MYSLQHKWIFVHPQKCGGTSIEKILRSYHSHDKIIMDHNSQHYNISDYIKVINRPIKEYFKFGCTRNPWDRMVSLYYHAKAHDGWIGGFEEYISQQGLYKKEKRALQCEYKFCHENKYVMDFVARIENFENDVKTITDRLGIKEYDLPHFDHSTNRPNRSYREYYSKEMKDFIAEKFAWDIKYFDYEF